MGTQVSPPQKGAEPPPRFSAHVYCGQTAGWIKVPLGTEGGLGLGDVVLDGDPALPQKVHCIQFSAHVYCGQTAGWMKMPLGTEVDLSVNHIVLDGNPVSPSPARERGTADFLFFGPCLLWPRSPISATAELLLLEALCRSHTSGTPHVVAAGALT